MSYFGKPRIFGEPLGLLLMRGGARTQTLAARALAAESATLEALIPLSDESGLVATDISGNERHGTYSSVGVTYAQESPDADRTGVLLTPAAGSVFIDVYNAGWEDVPASGEFSVMLCATKTAFDTDNATRWLALEADSSNRLLMGRGPSNFSFTHLAGGTSKTYATALPIGAADWMCCVITVSQANDRARLYINGYKIAELTGLGTWVGSLNSATTIIGAATKTGSTKHDGKLYGFGVWSGELSEAEAVSITGAYQAKCYLDSAAGNDTNDGLTSETPVASLPKAFDRLLPAGGIIHITAPEVTPLTSGATWSGGGALDLRASDPWYMDGATTYTDGWTDAGSGIFSRTVANDPNIVVVETLSGDPDLHLVLTENTATPTTPGAGEYGHSSGTLYIHLPADADANAHTIKVPTAFNLILASAGHIKIDNLVAHYATDDVIEFNGETAELTNCTARYGGNSGFALRAGTNTLSACIGEANRNDGFNATMVTVQTTATLTNCEGGYNQDEGASPHNASELTIVGGRYHHNGQGGVTAVQDAVLHLDSVLVDFNGRLNLAQGSRGGVNFFENTGGGSCVDTTCQNNTGEGFYCDSLGEVIVSGLVSGVSEGNTLADVLCV